MGLFDWLKSGVTATRLSVAGVPKPTAFGMPGSWPLVEPAALLDSNGTGVKDIKNVVDIKDLPQSLDIRTTARPRLRRITAVPAAPIPTMRPDPSAVTDHRKIDEDRAARPRFAALRVVMKAKKLVRPASESAKEMKLKRKAHDDAPVDPRKKLRFADPEATVILQYVKNHKKRKAEEVIDFAPSKRQLVESSQPPPQGNAGVRPQRKKRVLRPRIAYKWTFPGCWHNIFWLANNLFFTNPVEHGADREPEKQEAAQPIHCHPFQSNDDEQLKANNAVQSWLGTAETDVDASNPSSKAASEPSAAMTVQVTGTADQLVKAALIDVDAYASEEQESACGGAATEELFGRKKVQTSAQTSQSGQVALEDESAHDATAQESGDDVIEEQMQSETLRSQSNSVLSAPNMAAQEQDTRPTESETQIDNAPVNADTPWSKPSPVAEPRFGRNGPFGKWAQSVGIPDPAITGARGPPPAIPQLLLDDSVRRSTSGIPSELMRPSTDAVIASHQIVKGDGTKKGRNVARGDTGEAKLLSTSTAPEVYMSGGDPPTGPRADRDEKPARNSHLKAKGIRSSSEGESHHSQSAKQVSSDPMDLCDGVEQSAENGHSSSDVMDVDFASSSPEVDMLPPDQLSEANKNEPSSNMAVVSRARKLTLSAPQWRSILAGFCRPRAQQHCDAMNVDDTGDGWRPPISPDLERKMEDVKRENNAARRQQASAPSKYSAGPTMPARAKQDVNRFPPQGSHGRHGSNRKESGRQSSAQPPGRGESNARGDNMPPASRNSRQPLSARHDLNDRVDTDARPAHSGRQSGRLDAPLQHRGGRSNASEAMRSDPRLAVYQNGYGRKQSGGRTR